MAILRLFCRDCGGQLERGGISSQLSAVSFLVMGRFPSGDDSPVTDRFWDGECNGDVSTVTDVERYRRLQNDDGSTALAKLTLD